MAGTMNEATIVIKATDRFSDVMKTLSDANKHFTKDLDGTQKKLNALDRTQADLQQEIKKASKELRDTEKALAGVNDEMAQNTLRDKQMNLDNAKRNLKTVGQAARDAEKDFAKLSGTLSKADNKAGGGFGGTVKSLSENLKNSGLVNMAGSAFTDLVSFGITSSLGVPQAELVSGVLGGAVSGASMGLIAGPQGAAIGALVGAISGLVSGETKILEAKDDAFKSYVQEAAQGQWEAQSASLSAGSALAAQRETDRISFATLFKDKENWERISRVEKDIRDAQAKTTAEAYLSDLVDMANTTPFLYDDLTAMSKTLATYGYRADSIIPVLQTIGDTGAALGMTTSDMTMVATALGRMKSSDKTTLEYLNILNDRGVGAVGMLADAKKVSVGEMYDMISKGEVAGGEAAEIILAALTESFTGSMLEQSETFSGLTSTVKGLTQELDAAMGEGYDEARKSGLTAQKDWLGGESGQSMQEAYRMMGQWQASLENTKERLEREALESVMSGVVSGDYGDSAQRERLEELGEEYRAALDSYNQGNQEAGAEMGRILAEAKVIALNEYNASEGAQLVLESEKALIQTIRNDTSLDQNYWDAGYEKGQEFTKGLAAAFQEDLQDVLAVTAAMPLVRTYIDEGGNLVYIGGSYGPAHGSGYYDEGGNWTPCAVGLDYVPYDNFPALLHQGERVLTAEQARSERSGGGIDIHIDTLAVREEADVDKVAAALLERLELAGMRA